MQGRRRRSRPRGIRASPRACATLVAGLFRPRQRVVILLGLPCAVWLYASASDIARVHDPPPAFGPPLDVVIPVTGARQPFDDRFSLDMTIAVRACDAPARVVVEATGPAVGRARNWLRSAAPVALGVADDSIGPVRMFVGETVLGERRMFDPDFHGDGTTREVPTEPADHPAKGLDAASRGAVGVPPPIPSSMGQPSIDWAFEADWLRPRTHGTCYLRLPLVIGPGPGFPLVRLPRPRGHAWAGVDAASVELTGPRFHATPDAFDPPPLHAITDDSHPAPAHPRWPEWGCTRNRRAACNGGYVALSETNASGATSSALFLRGTLLGVVLALVAEALLGFRWPVRAQRRGRRRSARR